LSLLAGCEDAPPPPPPMVHYMTHMMVFFDTGSSSLSDRSKQNLSSMRSSLQLTVPLSPPNRKLCVIGNADNTGSEAINKQLSRRRADVVANYLVGFGIPPEQILVRSRGSSNLLVKTPPNTAEVQNRRVEVLFSGESCEKSEE
jgi:outer membrane protein OmpA-like peptidoglycan-associated protein